MTLFEKNIEYLNRTISGLKLSENQPVSEIRSICEQNNISFQNLVLFNLEASALNWNKIRFVFLDVDGVMTEGGMFYTEDGDEFKRFDTKDGMAIKEAMKAGIEFGIISSGVNSKIIQHRADMFGIKRVYVGAEPKLSVAQRWLDEMDLEWTEIGYIGDDINDLKMFEKVGIAACPSDASIPNKQSAHFVLESLGGHGCVREFMRYHPKLMDIL
ncbi:MAG: HAD-IIIA family hydrolase [Flavobacteriales bacterium]